MNESVSQSVGRLVGWLVGGWMGGGWVGERVCGLVSGWVGE